MTSFDFNFYFLFNTPHLSFKNSLYNVDVWSQSSGEGGDRSYVRKEVAALSQEEAEHNERLFGDTMTLLFPEESMKDRFYRDKDKENAARVWILSVKDQRVFIT